MTAKKWTRPVRRQHSLGGPGAGDPDNPIDPNSQLNHGNHLKAVPGPVNTENPTNYPGNSVASSILQTRSGLVLLSTFQQDTDRNFVPIDLSQPTVAPPRNPGASNTPREDLGSYHSVPNSKTLMGTLISSTHHNQATLLDVRPAIVAFHRFPVSSCPRKHRQSLPI